MSLTGRKMRWIVCGWFVAASDAVTDPTDGVATTLCDGLALSVGLLLVAALEPAVLADGVAGELAVLQAASANARIRRQATRRCQPADLE